MIIDMSSPIYEAPIDFPTIFVQNGPLPQNPDILEIDCVQGIGGSAGGQTIVAIDGSIPGSCACE